MKILSKGRIFFGILIPKRPILYTRGTVYERTENRVS